MKLTWTIAAKLYFIKSGYIRLVDDSHHTYSYGVCPTCNDPCLLRGTKTCSNKCSSKGENNGFYRKQHSAETKAHFSIVHTGGAHTDKTKDKMSKSRIGKKLSEAHVESLRLANTGEKNPQWDGGYASNNIPKYDLYAPKLEPYEKCRRDPDDDKVLQIMCTYCGIWYTPKCNEVQLRIGRGINKIGDGYRFYHSPECKQECPIYGKHKHYKGIKNTNSREVQPQLRQMIFARDNYTCQKCGSTKSLHCHHINPVKSNPIESADVDTCITLCKKCHKEVHKIPGCRYNELAAIPIC